MTADREPQSAGSAESLPWLGITAVATIMPATEAAQPEQPGSPARFLVRQTKYIIRAVSFQC